MGAGYAFSDEVSVSAITGDSDSAIRPGAAKRLEDRLQRTKRHGEVFTPGWLCNWMNNALDEQWFGRRDVFNRERRLISSVGQGTNDKEQRSQLDWETNQQPVEFPSVKGYE